MICRSTLGRAVPFGRPAFVFSEIDTCRVRLSRVRRAT